MCVAYVDFFFFQAEDGIRDLVRSRGLGDVYKRQIDQRVDPGVLDDVQVIVERSHRVQRGRDHPGKTPVSYTHLTLPTSDLV